MGDLVMRLAAPAILAWLGSGMLSSAVGQALATKPAASPVPALQIAPKTAAPSAPFLPQSLNPAIKPSPDGASPTPSPAPGQTAAPAPPKPVTDPIVAAALRLLEERKVQGPLVREPDLPAALAAAYTARNRPYWTAPAGVLASARAVAEELHRADDWGLNSRAFDVPALGPAETGTEALAAVEIALSTAVVTYAWHARGGRIEPTALSLWLDARARPLDVADLLDRIAASSDPSLALHRLHPQQPQFEWLRQAYVKARAQAKSLGVPTAAGPAETLAPGPLLKPGMRHADITIVRRRLDVAAAGDDPTYYDAGLAQAVAKFLREAGLNGSPQIGVKARSAFNASADASAPSGAARPAGNDSAAKRLLANMERWRWLPEDLGRLHVWNNLPEFETRVVKDGLVLHQERIIIGKPETQTPVFSDAMRVVVFLPDWGVPSSIKIKDILPRLKDGDGDVLSDKGMRIAVNGRTVDPGKFDWDRVDIRTIPIVQDPGPSNPLGQIKFLFPNKHDVYMHDTPGKHLFNQSVRTFSHGCIRVRNPKRLAEIVFGEDQGWDAGEIQSRLQAKAPVNARVPLGQRIPVHNVYFTTVADENGSVKTLGDIYGHDHRIIAALDGVPAGRIAQSDPARRLARELQDIAGDPGDGHASGAMSARPGVLNFTSAFVGGPRNQPTAARAALGGPVPVANAPPVAKAVSFSPAPAFGKNSGKGPVRWSATQARTMEGQ